MSGPKSKQLRYLQEAVRLNRARYEGLREVHRAPLRKRKLLRSLLRGGVRELNGGKTLYVGQMSPSCRLCLRGKSTSFKLTVQCNRGCFYCPNLKGDKNTPRPENFIAYQAPSLKEVIRSVEDARSRGCSITGGEPFLEFPRTLVYIRALRRRFGPRFRIHLYTNGLLATDRRLRRLKRAGLDEIRFDLAAIGYKTAPVYRALKYFEHVGVEIPAVPGDEEKVKKIMLELDAAGVRYLNLNELYFIRANVSRLKEHGFSAVCEGRRPVHDGFEGRMYPVKESEPAAARLLAFAAKNLRRLSVHYCTCAAKRNNHDQQLKRLARTCRKSHERIDPTGLLEKLVVRTDDPRRTERELLAAGFPRKRIHYSRSKKRLEASVDCAKRLSSRGYLYALVKVLPADAFADVSEHPLESGAGRL